MSKKNNNVDPNEYTDENVPDNEQTSEEPTGKATGYPTENHYFDHTKVSAPYVRLAFRKSGKKGDTVVKYDIRFCQPNFECMDTDEVHTLKHFLAEIFYKSFENVIDVSPNGSRTGFYVTMFDGVSEETMAKVVVEALQKIVVFSESSNVPFAEITSCSNVKDHSLIKAKKRAMMFIGGIMSKGFQAQ
jgi:S-ribosylhomocysteine lyase